MAVKNPLHVVFIWLLLTLPAVETPAAAEPLYHFSALQQRLIRDGFDAEKIRQLYGRDEIAFESKGVSLFFVHREAKLDYDQFTSRESLDLAEAYLRERRETLAQAETDFGVDRRIITAILLVESRFGKYIGKRTALNTLSTMAALDDPVVRADFWKKMTETRRIGRKRFEQKADRRSAWAYQELKALLTYAAREGLDPAAIHGSYAGAVGLPQFMPSNILRYGSDGDGDGLIDLTSHADAAASIASYLKAHGWRPGLSHSQAKKVIYSYNHSSYYVNAILKIADLLKG